MEVEEVPLMKFGIHAKKSYSDIVDGESGPAYVEELRQQKKQAKYVVDFLAWIDGRYAWGLGTADQANTFPKAKTR